MQAMNTRRSAVAGYVLIAAAGLAMLAGTARAQRDGGDGKGPSNVETLLDWARIVKGRSRDKLLDAIVVGVAHEARAGHTKANARTWRSVDKAVRDMGRSGDPVDRLLVGRLRLVQASAHLVDGGSDNIDKGVAILKVLQRDPRSPESIVDRAKSLQGVALLLRPRDDDPLGRRNRNKWRVDRLGLLDTVRKLYARTGDVAGLPLVRAGRKSLAGLVPPAPDAPADRKRPDGRLRREAEGVVASATDSFLASIEAIIAVDGLTGLQLVRHQESIRRYRIPPLVARAYRYALDTKVGRVAADGAFVLWVKKPHSKVRRQQLVRSLELLGANKINADLYYETLIGAWRTDRLLRTGRLDEDKKSFAAHLAPYKAQREQLKLTTPEILEAGDSPIERYVQALLDLYGPERSPAAMDALRDHDWNEKSPTQRALRRAVEYHVLRHNLRATGKGARFWHERHDRALAMHNETVAAKDPDADCAEAYKGLSDTMAARLARYVENHIAPPIGKEKIQLAVEYAWVLTPDALMKVLEPAATRERLLGDKEARVGLLNLADAINKASPGRADAIRKMLVDIPQESTDRLGYYYRNGQFDRCRQGVERIAGASKKVDPDALMLGAASKLQTGWAQAPSPTALAKQVAAWILKIKPGATSPYAHLRDMSGLTAGTADRRDMLVAMLYMARPKRPAGDAKSIIAACERARRHADRATSGPARAKAFDRLIGREGRMAGRIEALVRIRLARTLDGDERVAAMKQAAEGVLPDPAGKKGRVFYGEGLADRLPPVVRPDLAAAAFEGKSWARGAAVYELGLQLLTGRGALRVDDVESYRRWLQCRVLARAGDDPRRMPGLIRAEVKRTRSLVAGKEFRGVMDPPRRAAAALIWDDASAAARASAIAKLYRRMIARTAEVKLGGEEGNFNEWGPLRRHAGLNRYASLWCFAVIWPNTSGYRLKWAYRGSKWPAGLQKWVAGAVKGKPLPLAKFDALVDSWCAAAKGPGPSARDIRTEAYLMRYLLYKDRASLNRAVSTFAFGNPEYSLAVRLAGRASRRTR